MDQWVGPHWPTTSVFQIVKNRGIGGILLFMNYMYSVFTSPKVFGILLSLVLINVQNLSFMIYEILFLVESNILQ